MSTLINILLLTFLGSLAGLTGGLLLLANKKLISKVSPYLAAFAAGTLIGVAFFDLLPEAALFPWAAGGIIFFFLIERYLHSFHHHEKHHEHTREARTTVPLIVISDTMHNFVDGVVIAATFMAQPTLGMVTALAVLAHEVPQEIGDFGLLLHKGLSRLRVVVINILSASASFLGAIITYILGDILEGYIPILVSLTAGFFLYIALSDLVPEIQYEKKKRMATLQTLILISGMILIWGVVNLFEENL
ncbi:ZIP family metal transporter [Candidatus Microgenomates bacterium]|nr:ZIP family metal transporter [Candidatus Microgenomates bacterium]